TGFTNFEPSIASKWLELVKRIAHFARESNSALLVLPDLFTATHRQSIIALAARHRLPAVYPARYFVASGGLMSYGIELLETYRQAASYVDRILKGEKPADLPVQAPTKYELVINQNTAKAACARAASGHAVIAPPSSVMKSRRFTRSPRRRAR